MSPLQYNLNMPLFGTRQRRRLKTFIQLLPIIAISIVAIVGAANLKQIQEFLADATGEPANILVNVQATLGPLPQPWQNLAQGGEMSDWSLTPIQGKVAALQPQYIRLDHIYSFYDIVQNNNGQLSFNFSKLDPLVDEILATGAKPYLALSYMPATISADGTITGQPQSWPLWQETVRATVSHYSKEKGISGVIYEVWNEPDLFGNWKTYGDKNYLNLYAYAARGAQQVGDAKPFTFGGPAVTAAYENWFTKMAEYTRDNNLRWDFYSWHRYNTSVDQFREDFAEVRNWQARYPHLANLQLHVTEFGHDSENNPGYDTMYGAAHTVAVATEMINFVDRGFIFEIEDGKDPNNQAYWGRWGLLTHREFGNQIKPRYLAVRMLNQLQGEQLRVLGKGTWVKGAATRLNDSVQLLLVNYDQYGNHNENVPITFDGVLPGSYLIDVNELGGATRTMPLETTTTQLQTSIFMGPNSVVLLTLRPVSN